jgi:hypothetical protein
MIFRDTMAEEILDRLSDLENYPEDALASYEEFLVGGKTYYFTPGGFLYRKDQPGLEEVGASSAATLPMKYGTTDPTTASKAPPFNRAGLAPPRPVL